MGEMADYYSEEQMWPEDAYWGDPEADPEDDFGNVPPVCPYCKSAAVLTDGAEVYPNRPRLVQTRLWICRACDAYVGCHDGTINPLGTLANKALRVSRMRVHELFDPIWMSKKMKRGQAYGEMAAKLGIDRRRCHIGMFDEAMCKRAIDAAREIKLDLNRRERKS